MSFQRIPNLPDGRVSAVVMSCKDKQLAGTVSGLGIEIIDAGNCEALPWQTACHADINCLHLGGNDIAVIKENTRLIHRLSKYGMNVTPIEGVGNEYPNDCILNALILNGYCFSHNSSLNSDIIGRLRGNGICSERVFTRQGYARCSVAVVSDNAAITEDPGMAITLKNNGIDCMLVPEGEIYLKGYDRGFIGGACFKLSKDKLAFFGNAERLAYYKELKEFCEKNKVGVISLGNNSVKDIGGAVQLTAE